MTCNFFVIWGDPTKPDSAEIDESSFARLEDAEAHVNEQRRAGVERRDAAVFECIESNDSGLWRKAFK